MKHKIEDDIDVCVHIGIPAEDLSELIEQITESAITIIAVSTVANILRKWVT